MKSFPAVNSLVGAQLERGLRKTAIAGAGLMLAAAASAGSYTSTGGAIPDNAPLTPLIVTFAVTESGPLAALDLTLTGLTHTWIGDLIVTLTSPNATAVDILRRTTQTSNLATSLTGSSANFAGNYRFIDTGANISTTLGSNTSTFNLPSGDYMASSRTVGTTSSAPLSLNTLFAGTPLLGNWVLTISDNASLDTGALVSATLNVSAVPEASTFLMFGLGLVGIVALRRRGSKVA